MKFKLNAKYKPRGDQPHAIKSITHKLYNEITHQSLEGVTGSGKTFTIANVIKEYNKPVLILSHNKTLAAQLYSEFKDFFPTNLVEYFVSYYDYYQPEAYLPTTNTYIEKDLSINSEIEKFRLHTTSSLLSGRNDVIVISSVSCIYGLGNPLFFKEKTIQIKVGQIYHRKKLVNDLIDALYNRTKNHTINKGEFKILGDILIINSSHQDIQYKIHFWGNDIEMIEEINNTKQKGKRINQVQITPANIFITSKNDKKNAIKDIKNELMNQIIFFQKNNQYDEAKRIEERVNFDLEMIHELGYCSGIENYARYFDGRDKNTRPFCLMDYFPKDFLLVIDESHVTIPQLKAMYAGDQARKKTLVEYGFRLPSALDNRPLSFTEFEKIQKKVVFVSATLGEYECAKSHHHITEQLIRPTGLLEPEIIVHPSKNQIDNLINEISIRVEKEERILVTTLTKKMAEQLSQYLIEMGIKTTYIHSDIDTIKRIEIMKNLRTGNIDVLIGVNLLREGLDLPEVSLVAIMDADKEGFLRSKKSLIQTIGRAARHISGKSILYADHITNSIQETIDDNNRKREIQKKYNLMHKIKPEPVAQRNSSINMLKSIDKKPNESEIKIEELSVKELKKEIQKAKKLMNDAAISMNFMTAAKHRDYISILKKRIKSIF